MRARTGLLILLPLIALLGIVVMVDTSNTPPQDTPTPRQEFSYATRIYPWDLSDSELAKALDLAQSAGIDTIGFEARWAYLDQGDSGGKKRTYDWHDADRLVRAAEARGMEVDFLLTQTPDWVHPYLQDNVPDKEGRVWTAPKGDTELRHWSNFVSDVVRRYEGRVSHFEIWNEPNNEYHWKPRPQVDEYAALLRTAYLSAKGTDPDAKIVFGGLSENDLGYLNEYYRTVKASYPGAASHAYFFDTLDVHPYSADRSPDRYTRDAIHRSEYGEVDGNFLGFVRMKELMEDQGDPSKNLLLNEYGFSTTDTWMNALPDSRRALYLKRAYELARVTPYVEGMSWYDFNHDPRFAIVDEDFNPTLTYRAYKQVTGTETPSAKLTINLPSSIHSSTYPIEPRLTNLHSSDVSHWELYVDGALVGEYFATPIEWNTRGAEAGAHDVLVAAYTTEGSVWASNIAETNVVKN